MWIGIVLAMAVMAVIGKAISNAASYMDDSFRWGGRDGK